MSFTFEWPRFSDQFHADAIQMLNAALNKGNKPPVIADKIEVVELEMGTEPPELEIRDIGDLTLDHFRGIFRLTYAGDAHIVLRTKVQANPLNHKQPDIHLMGGSRGMLAAKQPLVVPMLLRLSHFKLNSYVVLVVSKQKGITLVFKTDPLQNVDINSTFDSIAVIQKYIQREIEGQLRQMFREDLPGIIHRLSQQWVKAKVEAPYLSKRPPVPPQRDLETMSMPDLPRSPRVSAVGIHPTLLRRQTTGVPGISRPRSPSNASVASTSRIASKPSPSSTPLMKTPPHEGPTTFPDIENFDPTYGMRPEGIPTKSLFSGFGSLFAPTKGLADLSEDPTEDGELDMASQSFDMVDWEDTIPDYSSPATEIDEEPVAEYETLPAVGGGTITRPRILHSQSQIHPPPEVSLRPLGGSEPRDMSSRFSSRAPSTTSSPRGILPALHPHAPPLGRSNSMSSSYFPTLPHQYARSVGDFTPSVEFPLSFRSPRNTGSILLPSQRPPPLYPSPLRPISPDGHARRASQTSSDMTPSVQTPPFTDLPRPDEEGLYMKRSSERRLSVTSSTYDFNAGSPPSSHHVPEPNPKIILGPTLNNSISQLSTLSHSNHTLSPYTRSLEHFTVRSVPRRGSGLSGQSNPAERQPVKAKRKRTYRIGGKPTPPVINQDEVAGPASPTPPSEFDASDMDHYFRTRDEVPSRHSSFTYDSPYARRRRPQQP
ncbi:hypothetical protein JAAARDRAFT_118324 [Jaapia argillacea MUCL 33604]|uniref:Mitochondrial distribution and morphology protein 34 n=1 Tax=Jaapia argillacea MUCL 33604 TaxID=933084 RepID=A0A067QPB2_9AGAM|nr:hypothetical protein JAAARDRAFT_118324 [Jaapia argillacea MUCL 33604]